MKMPILILLLTVCPFLSNCLAVENVDSLTKKIYSEQGNNPNKISLSYYFDYFSFVGSDSKGRVAFALDNNRGQDGEKFQAEHFLVLHDEHQGWENLSAKGLANKLKDFGIQPTRWKDKNNNDVRGYERKALKDTWERYP